MVQQSFYDRIERINQKTTQGEAEILVGPADIDGLRDKGRGKPARASGAAHGPGFLKLMMIGMLMIPVGMAISLMTTLFLDPEVTPAAANYLPLMAFVLVAHLGLFAGAVTAILSRFRRQTLNYVMLFVFTGYGMASAALSVALQ